MGVICDWHSVAISTTSRFKFLISSNAAENPTYSMLFEMLFVCSLFIIFTTKLPIRRSTYVSECSITGGSCFSMCSSTFDDFFVILKQGKVGLMHLCDGSLKEYIKQ